jgi:hypothetical protein
MAWNSINCGIATALAALSGCVPPPDAASASEVPGCYLFRWSVTDPLMVGRQPDSVWLQREIVCSSCGESKSEIRHAVGSAAKSPDTIIADLQGNPVTPPWHYRYYGSWWSERADGSVELLFYEPMEQWRLLLKTQGDSLTGRAEFSWDGGGAPPPVAVVANRIHCPQ